MSILPIYNQEQHYQLDQQQHHLYHCCQRQSEQQQRKNYEKQKHMELWQQQVTDYLQQQNSQESPFCEQEEYFEKTEQPIKSKRKSKETDNRRTYFLSFSRISKHRRKKKNCNNIEQHEEEYEQSQNQNQNQSLTSAANDKTTTLEKLKIWRLSFGLYHSCDELHTDNRKQSDNTNNVHVKNIPYHSYQKHFRHQFGEHFVSSDKVVLGSLKYLCACTGATLRNLSRKSKDLHKKNSHFSYVKV